MPYDGKDPFVYALTADNAPLTSINYYVQAWLDVFAKAGYVVLSISYETKTNHKGQVVGDCQLNVRIP